MPVYLRVLACCGVHLRLPAFGNCISTTLGTRSQHVGSHTGCVDLIYTGRGGKIEGLQMMTKVENGSHLGMSLVHCRKVAALILEPVSTGVFVPPCHLCLRQCDADVGSEH